jgi:hypothetical protein
MTENIIPFPSREPPEAQGSWCLILIERSEGLPGHFDLSAWTGLPTDPPSRRLYLGSRRSFREAAELARAKADELGVDEIADLSSVSPPTEPGAA